MLTRKTRNEMALKHSTLGLVLGSVELLNLDEEGDAIDEFLSLLGKTLTALCTRLHETELGKRFASPVKETLASAHAMLGTATVVFLAGKALAEATITFTRAEVEGTENGSTANIVPVLVLGSAFTAVGRLYQLGAVRHKQLAFLLEVASSGFNPAPGVNVTESGTFALANAGNLAASSDHC